MIDKPKVDVRDTNPKRVNDSFRTLRAKVSGLGLIGSVFAGSVGLCVLMEERDAAVVVSIWFATLLSMGVLLLPAYIRYRRRVIQVLGFVGCALLLLLPRTEAARRVLPACGTVSGASVLCVCRALTILLSSSNAIAMTTWPRWRVLFYFCAFGWHDFRDAFVWRDGASVAVVRDLIYSQVRSVAMAAVCVCTAIFVVGRPQLNSFAWIDVAGLVVVVYLRGALCAVAFYNAFVALDVSLRLAYVLALDGVGVDSAFGTVRVRKGKDPSSPFYVLTMNCASVAAFWSRFWNRPVNSLLVNGVYVPLTSTLSCSKNVAIFTVFLVSGLGHLCACNAVGMPWWIQICMLSFFLVQPCFILIERHGLVGRFVRGPMFVFLVISSSAPLFIEPLFFLFDWGIALGEDIPAFLKHLSVA